MHNCLKKEDFILAIEETVGHCRKRRTLHILMDNLIVELGFLNIKKKVCKQCARIWHCLEKNKTYCLVTDVI